MIFNLRTRLALRRTLAAAVLFAAAPSAGAATLDLGVPDQVEAAVAEAAGAFVEQTGHEVRLHVAPVPPGVIEQGREGRMDAIIPPCNNSSALFAASGWVRPETGRRIFCRRMAIILPAGDPENIDGLLDLLRPDVSTASLSALRPRIEKVAPFLCADPDESLGIMAAWLGRADLMMDLLAEGKVDAVLAWDTFAADDPHNFVVIRLPRSEAGDQACAPVTAFVTPASDEPEAAQELVDFLAGSVTAQDIFLRHGYMTDDGSGAADYDHIAARRFDRVYRSIVQQLIDDYAITSGSALDIGCGPGQMSLIMAEMTNLSVTGLDIEPEAIEIARRHAQEAGLAERCRFVCADAHSLPFPDNTFDLVVSRGTLSFLRDHVLAIREVYRVLRPGGVAFLGGGMGRYTPQQEAKKLYPGGVAPETALDWGHGETREDSIFPFPVRSFETLMTRAGIANYTVINEGGRWVEIRK